MMEPICVKLDEFTTVTLPCRYLYLNMMSERKKVGFTDELADNTNWSEVIEFRCFDEYGEVHGKRLPDKMHIWKWDREELQKKLNQTEAKLSQMTEKDSEKARISEEKAFFEAMSREDEIAFGMDKTKYILDQEYDLISGKDLLAGNCKDTPAKKLMIRRFVAYDEDGQGRIISSRLYGLK